MSTQLTFQIIENDENDKTGHRHGFKNSKIIAFSNNLEVAYIKITLLDSKTFKEYSPSVWHYMKQWQGWGINFNQDEEKICNDILNYMGIAHACSKDSLETKKKVIKDRQKEYKNRMKKTIEFFVDKPFVCYIDVNKDFRGKGISDELYSQASQLVKKQGYELYSDSTQTPAAKNMWNRFVSMNKAKIDGKRFIFI